MSAGNELPTIEEALDELGIELPRSRKLSCPTANDSEPSLHVYDDGFYCFHCGQSGDGLGLIAFFTGQNIRTLFAQRAGGDKTRARMQTKGMQRGDVHRAAHAMYREVHNEWFSFLHDTWKDAPLWAFEQSLDIWSQVFDDLRDRVLGHGVWEEEDPLTPYEAEQAIRHTKQLLESQRQREVDEAKTRKHDETRAAYWRRKRALVTAQVYEGR